MGTVVRIIFIVCLAGLGIVLLLGLALKLVAKSKTAGKALPKFKAPNNEIIIDAEIVEPKRAEAGTEDTSETVCENLAEIPGLTDEIQRDFGDLITKAQDETPATAKWDAKDRLELLEAKHGPLPPFIQSLFDKKKE